MWELHDGEGQVGPLDEAHVIRMLHHGVPATTMVRRVGTEDWKSPRSHAPFAIALEQRGAAVTAAANAYAPPPTPPPGLVPQQRPVTIEQTSKRWKGMQVGGLLACMLGLFGACGGASSNAPGVTVGGVVLFAIGFFVYLFGRFAAWWSNG